MRFALLLLIATTLAAPVVASAQDCNPFVPEALPALPDPSQSWLSLEPGFTPGGELWLFGLATPAAGGSGATLYLVREDSGDWVLEDSGIPANFPLKARLSLGDGPTAFALVEDAPGQYRVVRRLSSGAWQEDMVLAPATAPAILGADLVPGPAGSYELVLVAHDGSGGNPTLWTGPPGSLVPTPLLSGTRLASEDAAHRLPDGRVLVLLSRVAQLHAALVDGPQVDLQLVTNTPTQSDGYWAMAAHETDGRPRILYQFQSGRPLEQHFVAGSWEISRVHPLIASRLEHGAVRADGTLVLRSISQEATGTRRDHLVAVVGGRLGDNPMPPSPRHRDMVVHGAGGIVTISWTEDGDPGLPVTVDRLHPDYWQVAPPVPTVEFSSDPPTLNVPFSMEWSAPRSLVRATGLIPLHRCTGGTEGLIFSSDQPWQAWAANLAGASEGPPEFLDLRSFELRSYQANPMLVAPGDPVHLSWTIWGAAEVSVDGFGPQPLSGTLVDHPLVSRDYNLRIQGVGGEPEELHSIRVEVFEPGEPQFRLSWDGVGLPGLPPRVEDGVPFAVHLFATGVPDGVEAWELQLLLPPGLFLIGSELEGDAPVNLGNGTNFVVGTGRCLDASLLHRLATFILLAPDAEPLAGEWIGLGPATPSSFPGETLYSSCDAALRVLPTGPGLELREGTVPVLDLDLMGGAREGATWLGWSLPAGLEELRLEAVDELGRPEDLARWTAAPWPTRWEGHAAHERFRLSATLPGGEVARDEISLVESSAPPARVAISRVWPNPANPRVRIELALPQGGEASVRIVDVAGRLVRTLHRGVLPTGLSTLQWDGDDDRGTGVSSGSYFVELLADGRRARASLRLVR